MRGLEAKVRSWTFIISLAYCGEETMIVKTSPSCKCIKGPYILAKSRNFLCGVEVKRWCMFPIIGSFHGPGGIFGDDSVFLTFFDILSATIMNRKNGIIRAKVLVSASKSMVTQEIDSLWLSVVSAAGCS
ncbi:hypothetical protein VNO78_09807 [Psophocarpus tetragonolobus]|uniref:Uncharacterized protein n=1 Tax=Psophocarpus tetragonolobus TaxID=3891 RepID=A0AAN9XUA1_PSOTE